MVMASRKAGVARAVEEWAAGARAVGMTAVGAVGSARRHSIPYSSPQNPRSRGDHNSRGRPYSSRHTPKCNWMEDTVVVVAAVAVVVATVAVVRARR